MKDATIHPSAIVDEGAKIGKGTRVWHFAHIRGTAKVGEGCTIGKDVYIDVEVKIGNNVKIQNGVSVYQGVTIEDDVFCGPHMVFTNDMYPRSFAGTWEAVETLVKKGASIGANATIVCGTVLGEYSMIGSGSVVTSNVPAHGLVVGNPSRLVGFVCKCGQPLTMETGRSSTTVTFQCTKCKEKVEIPLSDYESKVR
jgi:acetyltransferase-like isoleucine patch superfamily enzyme